MGRIEIIKILGQYTTYRIQCKRRDLRSRFPYHDVFHKQMA